METRHPGTTRLIQGQGLLFCGTMKGFTVPQHHVGWLRILFVSLGTIIVMLAGFMVVMSILGTGPPASLPVSYGLAASYGRVLLAFATAASAGYVFCWGLMLGFTTCRQDLRWLSVYFGTHGAIVPVIFVTALIFFSDNSARAWQTLLAVGVAIAAGFLLCWALARWMGWIIGRFRSAQPHP